MTTPASLRTLMDEKASVQLLDAIHGRGAFRMLNHAIQQLGLEKDWFRFREKALADLARRWCAENEIPYTEDL